MRVLEVIPIMDPNKLWAGPHKVAYDIAKALIKRGHEVVVLTSDMLNIRMKIRQSVHKTNLHNYLKIVRAGTLSCKLTEMTNMTISIDTVNFLKRELKNFNVAHAHEYTTFENISLHHYATKHNIPYVLQAHGSLPKLEKACIKWFYDQVIGYRILRDASKVIALSEIEARQYEKMGVPRRAIVIIPNGIDLEEYTNLPPKGSFKNKFNIDDDEKIILYLGRIHRTKGIDFLIEAYAYLINNMKCNDVELVIAGPDDGYLAEARTLTNNLGVSDSVLFTGFISRENKLRALVDADVFVTPSFYGFPITFLEACATGTPIITTTLGDTLEWIDDNIGYATSPTHYDLARAIYAIVSDDGLHRKFSRNCIKIVKSEFSLKKMVDRLEKVYREVADW